MTGIVSVFLVVPCSHAGLKWDAVPTIVNAPNPPPPLDLELKRKPPKTRQELPPKRRKINTGILWEACQILVWKLTLSIYISIWESNTSLFCCNVILVTNFPNLCLFFRQKKLYCLPAKCRHIHCRQCSTIHWFRDWYYLTWCCCSKTFDATDTTVATNVATNGIANRPRSCCQGTCPEDED